LLAWEVAEKLNDEGVRCSLKTGQEKSISEFDTHISCTIEMCNTQDEFDVAVIDEIQMISDSQRGWAWTHALLAVKAKEIHLCGDQRSLQLISKICLQTQDTLKIREYKRMSTLKVESKPIRSFKDLVPGD
jgi:ATP-dependent RNA helicase SUPV3L1/SUV3